MEDRFRFRVWNKKNKEMIYNAEIAYDGMNYNTSWQIGKNTNDGWVDCFGYYLDYPEDYEVMQCTGLKDKNGKLIYEGDIVDKGTRCKWIITWFKNRFILVPDFEYKNKDKCASDRDCGFKYFENNHNYADKNDEVIGNIYENPELLED